LVYSLLHRWVNLQIHNATRGRRIETPTQGLQQTVQADHIAHAVTLAPKTVRGLAERRGERCEATLNKEHLFRIPVTCGAADRNAGPGYGISFRAAGNFRQRIETKQDLPAQELEESLGEAFALAG